MDQRQQFGFTGDETAPTDSGFIQNGFNDLTKTEPLTPLQSGFVDQNFDGGNGFVPGFGQNIDPRTPSSAPCAQRSIRTPRCPCLIRMTPRTSVR